MLACSQLVNAVMLRRTNEVIAKYLPPKVDWLVFCSLTLAQRQLYSEAVAAGRRALDDEGEVSMCNETARVTVWARGRCLSASRPLPTDDR